MKLKHFVLLIITVLPLLTLFTCGENSGVPASLTSDNNETGVYVAHAGGVCDGYIGTNSLEAMTESIKQGYKFIEVDIMKTSDGRYVLNHDWEYMSNRAAFAEDDITDYETFLKYKINGRFTAMGLDDLIKFLDEYDDVRIITDVKDENYSVLRYIKNKYRKYVNRFVPQVYAFDEYASVKRLGFRNIIITLYAMPYNIITDPEYIYNQAKKLKPYAITVPDMLLTDEYISKLRTDEIRYFTHTINDSVQAEEMFGKGIYGVYTDNLLAGDYREIYNEKISALDESISALSDEEKSLLSDCLIYRYDSEVCVTNGKAGMIYTDIPLTPLSNGSNAYFPLAKTVIYLGGEEYLYVASEQAITFKYNGFSYKIGKAGIYKDESDADPNEKVVIYCNAYYCSDTFFKSEFDCIIYENDGYLVISKDKKKDMVKLESVLKKLKWSK